MTESYRDIDLNKLRWIVESRMAADCYYKELEDKSHICKCQDPYKMSREELLAYLDQIDNSK